MTRNAPSTGRTPPPSLPLPPAPWLSRDIFGAAERTVGDTTYRVEVRAFLMDREAAPEPCYCVHTLREGRWVHLRPSRLAPDSVARVGTQLVAAAAGVDLSSASYTPGASIDRTSECGPQLALA